MRSTPTRQRQAAPRSRPGGAGGDRLAAAFDAVSSLPALAEAQRRVLALSSAEAVSEIELAEAIESDTALAIRVMRAANNGAGPSGRIAAVPEALADLTPEGIGELVRELETYDLIAQPGRASVRFDAFRRHGVSVRIATDRIAEIARLGRRDELAIAALLHDVGHLVLVELYGDEIGLPAREASPEDRLHAERRELGIDHALVGGVLIRRWGLPAAIAAAVERHHSPEAADHAAAIRLGDMIVHQAAGDAISPEALGDVAETLGIGQEALSALLYEFPHAGDRRRRASEPCPLSARELDALRGLAEGRVYKQIAQELKLSVSTVRTHLHNVYRKIGAVDRAQAVLIARDKGWL